jgi:2-methylcitrate dehydratase PrpD
MTESGSRTATERIAEFAASAGFEAIPEKARAVAKNALLDWLGVTIAGSREPVSTLITEHARKAGARAEARAICQGFQTTAELAALVNGTAGHAIDFDDTFPDAVHYNIHPSVCLFPAVLALAEKHKLPGHRVLTAYVAGLEVIYRIGAAIGESSSKNGWHPTPVIGTMGAAAACVNALGLDQDRARHTLGIAASLSGGLYKNFGSMTKPLHAGNAARNGVVSAELAASGFTGNPDIFGDGFSFGRMFGDKEISELLDTEKDLGNAWKTASTGLVFKPYPSCRSTHASIDAALFLRDKHHIRTEQVSGIACEISPMHTRLARFHRPETGYQGKFSIPYCIATALRNGRVSLEDFSDEKVKAAGAQDLLKKVSFLHPEGQPASAMDLKAEITITLKTGGRYSHTVSLPKGEPENPLTDEELTRKFEICSGLVLNRNRVGQILDAVLHLEEAADLTRLFAVLAGSETEP